MRLIFLLLVLGGIGASFVYPWAVTNFSGHEVGTWRVYDRGQAFQPVVARLNADIARALAMPDVKSWIEAQAGVGGGGSPEQLAAFQAAETTKWAALVKAANIKPQ